MRTLSSLSLFRYLLLLVCVAFAATSCKDDDQDASDPEFSVNWQQRNAAYFDSVYHVAAKEVAQAKAAYGDDWEANCDWRVYPSYAKVDGSLTDSICARVIDHGTGSGFPMYRDSVKVNYMGHLIPTSSYSNGRVFDHSGIYENENSVFDADYSVPTRFAVDNLVEGFTTALLHMRIGDRWMVYIPQQLGYGSGAQGVMPAYSTLCFDMQLKGFCRKGSSFD